MTLPAVVLAAAVLTFLLPRLAGVDTVRAVLRTRIAEAEPDPAAARVAVELGLAGRRAPGKGRASPS
ncbi:hypothetical protein [Pseudonocardia adelaidensis]|uniref:Uncharacterized protein n=1 Tax=Pseudonocardia adelaidensis TaxID=648754 RepID=A0ABP9NJM7_9PSEU